MRIPAILFLASILAAPAPAGAKDTAPPAAQGQPEPKGNPYVLEMVGHVESSRLRRTVERLAACGTRHSLSITNSPTRGIGAARHWLEDETQSLAALPGSRLVPFEDVFTAEVGPRVPRATEMASIGVMLPGLDTSRGKDALLVAGHYDSRANDILDAESDAPGAVDDASGVALTLEMAHVMARDRTAINIFFVATAGGEQGELGAAHLARRLKAEGYNILGMLAADCVGNTSGPGGAKVNTSVRLFSEGVPAAESEPQRRVREAIGLENDSSSRELARYLKRMGEPYAESMTCLVMLRRDRVGRGGDHLAFNKEGFPAARVTETLENFDRQHQVPRIEGGHTYGDSTVFFDPGYCAKITREMAGAFHHLAVAPEAPADVVMSTGPNGGVRLRWAPMSDPRIAGVVVYWRPADTVAWQGGRFFPKADHIDLPEPGGVDNSFFAVATVSPEGDQSLAVAPVRAE